MAVIFMMAVSLALKVWRNKLSKLMSQPIKKLLDSHEANSYMQ